MNVCMNVSVYERMYASMYVSRVLSSAYVCIYVHMLVCMCVCMHVCVCACTYVNQYSCMCSYLYVPYCLKKNKKLSSKYGVSINNTCIHKHIYTHSPIFMRVLIPVCSLLSFFALNCRRNMECLYIIHVYINIYIHTAQYSCVCSYLYVPYCLFLH